MNKLLVFITVFTVFTITQASEHASLNTDFDHLKIISYEPTSITGRGVKIAVIDAGYFDVSGDSKNSLTSSTIERFRNQHEPSKEEQEGKLFGHLNTIASIIAGNNGIAKDVELELFSVPQEIENGDDEVFNRWVAQFIREAIACKVDFISISLGFEKEGTVGKCSAFPEIVADALKDAKKMGIGILLCASNGSPEYTLNENVYLGIADLLESLDGYALLVMGVKWNESPDQLVMDKGYSYTDRLAPFIVCAPSNKVLAFGVGIQQISCNGTSIATPMVAATAALIKSGNKNLNNQQVLNLISRTSQRFKAKNMRRELVPRASGIGMRSILVEECSDAPCGNGVINIKDALCEAINKK